MAYTIFLEIYGIRAHHYGMQDIIFYKKTEPESLRKRSGETLAEARERAGEKLARQRAAFIGPQTPKPTHAEGVVRGAVVLNQYKEMLEQWKDFPEFAQAFSDFENKRGFWANRSLEWPEETETREALITRREVSVRPLTRVSSCAP